MIVSGGAGLLVGLLLVGCTAAEALASQGRGLEVREILRFNSFETVSGMKILGAVRGVELDAQGNLYVVDQQAAAVYVFDPSGRPLRTLGHSGNGPGEFTRPTGVRSAPNGTVWVADPEGLRYTTFARDGSVLATHRRDLTAGYGLTWDGVLGADGRIFERTIVRRSRPQEVEDVILSWMPVGGRLQPADTFPRYLAPPAATWTPPQRQPASGRVERAVEIPVPFSSQSRDRLDPRGGFWTGETHTLRFIRRSWAGDTLQVVERMGVVPRPVTAADRRRVTEELVARYGEGVRFALPELPDRMPLWDQLWADSAGRLWVERFRPPGTGASEPHVWEVYGPDGAFLGEFPLALEASPMPVARGDRLVGVVRDELDVDWVVLFEVSEA